MSEYPEIAARFARETAEHEMEIKHDDGLYRDLRDWDWSFLRICHAIVWGISRYDAAKAAQQGGEAK